MYRNSSKALTRKFLIGQSPSRVYGTRRAQSSVVEVLLIALGASVCLTVLLVRSGVSVESIRSGRIESESVLLNYLNYRPFYYNESFSFLISKACVNASLFESDSYLFNETVRVIQALNDNNSFILFANSSSNWVVFNRQASVCLADAQLASYELNGCVIIYGSWLGTKPLTC